MVVYSSVNVPGTEFIALNGSLPSCLSSSEPHVVSSNDSILMVRPAVVKKEGTIFWTCFCTGLVFRMLSRTRPSNQLLSSISDVIS